MNTYKKIEIGDKYGYWTVKGYAGKRGSRNKDYWNCECKCGCNKDVLGETLKNGRSSSCGCMQKEMARGKGIEKREIFLKPGDKFGNWIVLNFYGKNPYDEDKSANTYLCECDCPWHTRKVLYASHLANGNTTACKKCSKFKDLIGKKFGKLLVLELDMDRIKNDSKNRIYYICQCDCGKILSVRQDSLTSRGDNASCGCTEFEDLSGQIFDMLTVISYYDTIEIKGETYTANKRRWKCQCSCGNIIIVREDNLLNGISGSCGCRKESISEQKTREILQKWNIQYVQQYKFEECRYENMLPFDFYIPSKKICIELDGEDHYHPINRGKWDEDELMERFKDRQLKDSIKTEYCRTHKIKLIRIPYWDFDDIEYILFDKFVKYGLIEEIKSA